MLNIMGFLFASQIIRSSQLQGDFWPYCLQSYPILFSALENLGHTFFLIQGEVKYTSLFQREKKDLQILGFVWRVLLDIFSSSNLMGPSSLNSLAW